MRLNITHCTWFRRDSKYQENLCPKQNLLKRCMKSSRNKNVKLRGTVPSWWLCAEQRRGSGGEGSSSGMLSSLYKGKATPLAAGRPLTALPHAGRSAEAMGSLWGGGLAGPAQGSRSRRRAGPAAPSRAGSTGQGRQRRAQRGPSPSGAGTGRAPPAVTSPPAPVALCCPLPAPRTAGPAPWGGGARGPARPGTPGILPGTGERARGLQPCAGTPRAAETLTERGPHGQAAPSHQTHPRLEKEHEDLSVRVSRLRCLHWSANFSKNGFARQHWTLAIAANTDNSIIIPQSSKGHYLCLSRELGPDEPLWSLPAQPVLCPSFCELQQLLMLHPLHQVLLYNGQ